MPFSLYLRLTEHPSGVSVKPGGGDVEEAADPVPGSKVLPASIVDTLFALLDVNDDGRLNQEEFMTLMKRQTAIPDPVSLSASRL